MENQQYVKDLYQDIFGRSHDQGGLDYWTSQLDSGTTTKDDVRNLFAQSDEGKSKVADLYANLLERDVTSSGTDEFSTNDPGETDASYWLNDLANDMDGSYNNLDRVESNIKLSDEYKALQASKGDANADGIIDDGEVPGITESTLGDINKRIDDLIAANGGTDIDAITQNVLSKLNADTGGVGLTGTGGTGSGNLAAGTLDQTNNEAIKALIDTIVNDKTKDIKSTDLTGVLDKIAGVKGDLTKLQGDFSGLNTSTNFTGADNLAAIKSVLDAEGYTDQLTNLDSTYSNKIGDLQTTLTNLTGGNQAAIAGLQNELGSNRSSIAGLQNELGSNRSSITNLSSDLANLVKGNKDLEGKFNDLNLDVTDLSGDFEVKLGLLKSDLTEKTGAKFSDIQSKYDITQNNIKNLGSNLDDAKSQSAKNLSDLKSDMAGDLSDSEARLSGDLSASEARLSDDILSSTASSARSLAAAQKLWDSKLNENTAIQSNNFTNLSSDVNSKLNTFSKEQESKFSDVYQSRERAIDKLSSDWGSQLQKQEQGLSSRIQMTSENLNQRLTDISKNMNYRMLGDSAAGVRMRRSKAFKTGKTTQGSGQLNRSMRIQTLNI